jgi:hypothetical protein
MVTKTDTFDGICMLIVGSPDDDLSHLVLYFWNFSFTLPYRQGFCNLMCFSLQVKDGKSPTYSDLITEPVIKKYLFL